MITALPTRTAHERSCRVAAGIVAAAATWPDIAAVIVLDADLRALGRDHAAPWAWTAEGLRPYTEREAARFHAAQRALHRVLPRMRAELDGMTARALPLMPARWQARPVEHRPGPVWPLLPAASLRIP